MVEDIKQLFLTILTSQSQERLEKENVEWARHRTMIL